MRTKGPGPGPTRSTTAARLVVVAPGSGLVQRDPNGGLETPGEPGTPREAAKREARAAGDPDIRKTGPCPDEKKTPHGHDAPPLF